MSEAPLLLIVSDGRGETAQRLVNSALVQFERRDARIEIIGNVRSEEAVRRVIERAAAERAVVFYTLVSAETREAMRVGARGRMVATVDLLGPSLTALHDVLKAEPAAQPGLLYESDREHFDRMEAIDFTLKHDDGQHQDLLRDAHVVLVGVSRASKSSTCFYLGYHGIRAANVPLVPEIPPSDHLVRLDPDRVIGLVINPFRLKTVREVRARHLPRGMEDYLDTQRIAREVRWAGDVMAAHGWRTIDVSYMAIEEVAREVVDLRGLPLRIPR